MTTICFIRHGQTNVNQLRKIQGRKDHPLNDTGRDQALQTALFLKENDPSWDFIYSSPLNRAYETASIIKSVLEFKGEIIKDYHFIERDFGDAEDQDITDEIFKYIINDDINNLEKSTDIQKRVSEGILNLHTIKGLLTFVDKNRTFLDPLFNCSMSYFKIDNNEIFIDKINITPDI